MAKTTRITMTKAQAESPEGKGLIDRILRICHDGEVTIGEVEDLHIFLREKSKCAIPAIAFLRAITRGIVADGTIDASEAYQLKKAFERVVPKEVRGIVSTHLENIGLPVTDFDEPAAPWTSHAATARQIEYIVALGGRPTSDMTKGQASDLIDDLLERRPPTPRQLMLVRFFGEMHRTRHTKDEVSEWVDIIFTEKPRFERAWERFKRLTNHDPRGMDPNVVPVGAYVNYIDGGDDDVVVPPPVYGKATHVSRRKSRIGCVGMIVIFFILATLAVFLIGYLNRP